jgi:hypothetical protein
VYLQALLQYVTMSPCFLTLVGINTDSFHDCNSYEIVQQKGFALLAQEAMRIEK